MKFWQLAQNLGKGLRTYLCRSSRCLAECSKPYLCFHTTSPFFSVLAGKNRPSAGLSHPAQKKIEYDLYRSYSIIITSKIKGKNSESLHILKKSRFSPALAEVLPLHILHSSGAVKAE